MPKKIELLYGRQQLSFSLPEGAQPTVIRKKPLPRLIDSARAVREALDHPIAAKPLAELARGRQSACILICDITRPVPNKLFLRPMIEELLHAGVPAAQIVVLVATGLHRPNEGAELEELVGDPWVLKTVRVENHFARNDEDHVDLGRTAVRNTPVKIDRRFVGADLRIVTGLIEPHFMAGWSGGRKVIAPGVAHHETIRTFHSARFMEDPAAIQCNLKGNPLHEEQIEIARMIGEVYALNTVIDEDRNLIYVNFGEVESSHLRAVEFITAATAIGVPRRFHTVVTSSAGYPLDKTYYQTVKGMVTPMDIMEPGGTLIIASECSEGLGSKEFRRSQEKLAEIGPERFLAMLQGKTLADVDEWETEMQLKPMRLGRIKFYTTGLSEEDRRITCVDLIDSVEEAVRQSIEEHGDAAVAVIPEGPYVVPVFAAQGASVR
jgi:nickel-dependent lactate racemase